MRSDADRGRKVARMQASDDVLLAESGSERRPEIRDSCSNRLRERREEAEKGDGTK